ncbi:MAG: RidA family protein [Anaerolineales bacterium]
MSSAHEHGVVGKPTTSYSPALIAPAGRTVFISGQVAMDPEGKLVGDQDFERQCRQTFENVRSLVEQAGGSMKNIVKITTFTKDMSRYAVFSKVRGEVFQAPYPASTMVEVSDLFKPGLLIEIEAIAVLP